MAWLSATTQPSTNCLDSTTKCKRLPQPSMPATMSISLTVPTTSTCKKPSTKDSSNQPHWNEPSRTCCATSSVQDSSTRTLTSIARKTSFWIRPKSAKHHTTLPSSPSCCWRTTASCHSKTPRTSFSPVLTPTPCGRCVATIPSLPCSISGRRWRPTLSIPTS